jgi:hypothetical protein
VTREEMWNKLAGEYGSPPEGLNVDFRAPEFRFVAVQTDATHHAWYTGAQTFAEALRHCQEADVLEGQWSPPLIYDMDTGESIQTFIKYVLEEEES